MLDNAGRKVHSLPFSHILTLFVKTSYESDIPSIQIKTSPHLRIPRAQCHQRWPQGTGQSPRQGSQAPDPGLNSLSTQTSSHQRLRNARDFEQARERGVRMFRPGFIFQISPQPNPADSDNAPVRLGIIASRKVGKAHERNLARRRLRELFRQHQSLLPTGTDLVLIIRTGIRKQSFEEIRQDFLHCIRKFQAA